MSENKYKMHDLIVDSINKIIHIHFSKEELFLKRPGVYGGCGNNSPKTLVAPMQFCFFPNLNQKYLKILEERK